mgnify:CR=1 FL=1
MAYGYAVIDTETTGLTPQGNRIIEIAAVGLRADGSVEGEWSTLLNPDRDLGRIDIHHISAREVLSAPHFPDIAGDLAGLLRGRVIVGHNVRFDAGFVEAEYRRAGYAVTIPSAACLCTMRLSSQVLPRAPRTLEACCAQVGVVNQTAHSALADARATVALLQRLAPAFGGFPGLSRSIGVDQRLAAIELPPLNYQGVPCVQRGEPGVQDVPYLDRLASHLPPVAGPTEHSEYLALLDRALIDRVLSVRETDALVHLATALGIDRPTAGRLNADYLSALAQAAVADGEVTASELRDLAQVAQLLGLGVDAAQSALEQAWQDMRRQTATSIHDQSGRRIGPSFHLAPGDMVVFTGQTARPREELEWIAVRAGLVPHPSVTKKVAVLGAADPDSLSTKARKAVEYGIPIITETAFVRMMDSLTMEG